jgi:hypothetical protein
MELIDQLRKILKAVTPPAPGQLSVRLGVEPNRPEDPAGRRSVSKPVLHWPDREAKEQDDRELVTLSSGHQDLLPIGADPAAHVCERCKQASMRADHHHT